VLKDENQKCYILAIDAHKNIDWKKFHKLDLILLIPSIILGSYFITLTCEGLPYYFNSLYLYTQTEFTETQSTLIPFFTLVITFMLRTIGAFFILSAAIMAVPSQLILIAILIYMAFSIETYTQYQLQTQNLLNYATTIIIVSDIIRMLLLTWIISKIPRKKKKEAILRKVTE
jgi:hypothetical protein